MSEYGQKLYKDLMNLLVTNPDSFKFKDYKAEDGAVFRILEMGWTGVMVVIEKDPVTRDSTNV